MLTGVLFRLTRVSFWANLNFTSCNINECPMAASDMETSADLKRKSKNKRSHGPSKN